MTSPTNGHSSARRRKASIEIYFVLYLSAIVLLLGTTRTTPTVTSESIIDSTLRNLLVDFDVGVERIALVYTIVPAGLLGDTSTTGLKRDSLNVVRARGNVRDVNFYIAAIRDTVSGRPLPIESASIEREGSHAAIVRCSPNRVAPNRVYEVTVAASAMPTAPEGMSPGRRKEVEEVLRRGGRVTDTVRFTISVFSISHRGMIPAILAAQRKIVDTPSMPLADQGTVAGTSRTGGVLWADAGVGEIRRAAGSRWDHVVMISGVRNAATDLAFAVEPTNVRLETIGPNRIRLNGTTPRTGTQQVVLTAFDRGDRRVYATARFNVSAAQFPEPNIPQTMFVEQSYAIDMSSRDVPLAEIETEIVENGRSTRHAAVVQYRPLHVGPVQIYRVHNGQRLDPSYSVEVTELPRPVIQEPVRSADDPNEVVVTTVAWGTVGGRQNTVNLRAIDGNAEKYPELIESRFDQASKKVVQRWRVRRETSARQFTFRLWAIDLRGSRMATAVTFSVPE